jgi:hypothetical protein
VTCRALTVTAREPSILRELIPGSPGKQRIEDEASKDKPGSIAPGPSRAAALSRFGAKMTVLELSALSMPQQRDH